LWDLILYAHDFIIKERIVYKLLNLLDKQPVLLLLSESGIIPINQILLPEEIGLYTMIFYVIVVFILSLLHSFNCIIFFLAIVLYNLVQNGLLF